MRWTEAPWMNELARYGFRIPVASVHAGRRGVFIHATPQGRRGVLRTFWTSGDSELDVLSSSMEACFDFDTAEGEEPAFSNVQDPSSICVSDVGADADILRHCFRFRFERSWAGLLSGSPADGFANDGCHSSRTRYDSDRHTGIAGVLCSVVTRPGLPRRPLMLERLNKVRMKAGKAALLEQIEASHLSCRSTNRAAAVRRSRLDEHQDCTMCAAIWCDGAISYFGAYRICAAVQGQDCCGPARSRGSSSRRIAHRTAAAIESSVKFAESLSPTSPTSRPPPCSNVARLQRVHHAMAEGRVGHANQALITLSAAPAPFLSV